LQRISPTNEELFWLVFSRANQFTAIPEHQSD